MTFIPQPLTITTQIQQPQAVIRAGSTVAPNNGIGTSAAQVLPADPTRTKIIFHNPHASNTLWVCQSIDNTNAALTPTTSALSGAFTLLPGAILPFEGVGLCGTAWKALASAGSTPITIMTSNVP